MHNSSTDNQNPSPQEKKSYHAPTLRVFGDIRELTLASVGPNLTADGPGNYGPGPGGINGSGVS